MGPTRKRDLAAAVTVATVITYLLIGTLYQWFPPITPWTGVSLLGVAVVEAWWGRYVRAKITDNQIGDGSGRLHPLAVARTVTIAKASTWVGALVLGWWLGVLIYLLPRRGWQRVAADDFPGVLVAAAFALALIVAGLWLQHCCRKPEEPPESGAAAAD